MSQIINLSAPNQNMGRNTYVQIENKKETEIIVKNYGASFSENAEYLTAKYPDCLLLDLHIVAKELNVSYEFIRKAAKRGKVNFISFGKKMNIHKHELARIITEGIK